MGPGEWDPFMLGEEEETEIIDSNGYEMDDSSISDEYSYIFAEENPVLLSTILNTLGIEEKIDNVGQVIDDEQRCRTQQDISMHHIRYHRSDRLPSDNGAVS